MPKPMRKKNPRRMGKAKVSRLGLRTAKGLQALRELPEGVLSDPEQTILRRIQDIHTGSAAGQLTNSDYLNMRKIAARHNIRLV